jgi:hypothetical protein
MADRCKRATAGTEEVWRYLRINQRAFDTIGASAFFDLVAHLKSESGR